MIIQIHDTKTIADLQEKFSQFFPFLKIEFYDQPHHWYEESPEKTAYGASYKIGDIRKQHDHGDLEIHSWYRTGDLEQSFSKKFDLNVQVFRLHGENWVQTAGTDKFTLKEQNEIARQATIDSRPVSDSRTEKNNLF